MNILSIQSHVAYGHVGNASAVFPMQRLGSRSGRSTRCSSPINRLRRLARAASSTGRRCRGPRRRHPRARRARPCDGVLSGYMGSADIGDRDPRCRRDAVRAANPKALYCCDPVIGDTGRASIVRPGIAEFMRERAVPAADILTPNQFELELLTGRVDRHARRRQARGRRSAGARSARGARHLARRPPTTPPDAHRHARGRGRQFWRVRTPAPRPCR